jgi:RHS repeat-associated protein
MTHEWSRAPPYLLADHLGSTVGTVSADGSEVHQVRYWPYGAVRSGGVGTDRMYTGQQMEAGSALAAYFYHARFYSTALGYFLSAGQRTTDGLNRYAYVRWNPISYNDPTGLDAASDLKALAAAFAVWLSWGGAQETFLTALELDLNWRAILSGAIEITGRPLATHPELVEAASRYGYESVERMLADVITSGKLTYDAKTGHFQYIKMMPDQTLTRVTFDPNPPGQGIRVFSAQSGLRQSWLRNNAETGRFKEVRGKYNPREGGPPPPVRDDDGPGPSGGGSADGGSDDPWYEDVLGGIQEVFIDLPDLGDGTCSQDPECD